MTKYLANIIDFLNHDISISNVTTPTEKIHEFLNKFNAGVQSELDRELLERTEF